MTHSSKSRFCLIALLAWAVSSLDAAADTAPEPPGYLGLIYTIQNETAPAPRQWLYVRMVAPGGPAQAAGLQAQDIITAINGKPVRFRSERAALDFFASIRPLTVLRFTIVRSGKERVVSVRAAKMSAVDAERWKKNYELAKRRDSKQQ